MLHKGGNIYAKEKKLKNNFIVVLYYSGCHRRNSAMEKSYQNNNRTVWRNNRIRFIRRRKSKEKMDATPSYPQGFHSSLFSFMPYHFVDRRVKLPKHMERFNNSTAYCSIFKENVERDSSILQQPKEGQYYHLAKGKSKEIQEGFYVEKDDYEKGLLILALQTGHDGPVKTALEVLP